jgi:hypothetical protein
MSDLSKSIVAMKDGIVGFLKLERVLAFVCIFIPLILILFDCNKVRDSISAYADMEQNQVFVFLLTLASMMFLVNGVVKEKNWYNSILGISLMGVALFHYVDFRITHIVFAVIFFLGSAIVISYYTSKKQKLVACLLAIIIVFSLVAHFWLDWISLFVAEWIALGIIGIHYILESFKILD